MRSSVEQFLIKGLSINKIGQALLVVSLDRIAGRDSLTIRV
jgi:hypothetical protein